MKLYPRDHNQPESGEEVGNALRKLIEDNLDIKHWKFRLAFTKFIETSNIMIIYDSEWCRISFMFSRMRFPDKDELSIDYGRLHAVNEEPFMVWKGEECRCWHNVLVPLRFLDGLTPTEAYKQVMIEKQLPAAVRDFRESKEGKQLMEEYPPKSAIALQARLWEQYGQRLFELFDLRRPELWEAYQRFLGEYYPLLGMKSAYGPPYENVC